MTNLVKYFDELYVGVKEGNVGSSGYPLGFATPGGDDKAAEKRKDTVNRWVKGRYRSNTEPGDVGKVYSNEPRTGFEIVEWASRYSTDNKVARILDPNGYELEIYIPNLMDLILNCDILKGEIDAELVWVREGNNNRLVRADSDTFKNAVPGNQVAAKNRKKAASYKVGDVIENTWGRFLYCGLMNIEHVYPVGDLVVDQVATQDANRWHARSSLFNSRYSTTIYKIDPKGEGSFDRGRMHVYRDLSWSINGFTKGGLKFSNPDRVNLRKSRMAVQQVLSSGHNDQVPDFDETQRWECDVYAYHNADGKAVSQAEYSDNYAGGRRTPGAEQWFSTKTIRLNDGKMGPLPPIV